MIDSVLRAAGDVAYRFGMIPANRRDAYAENITAVAGPGARLILVGFSRILGAGLDPEDLLTRLRGWRLVQFGRVPGEQMCQYISGPSLLRAALKREAFHPMRCELERTSASLPAAVAAHSAAS